ncbi:LpxI family protein [Roseovarius pelagicus]|uniref:UDP-2,3-diacylglucosamine diphosphatase LpxI n=1 Tax=Roseovarius pelagicus TaxID=2980108 RepID=A0ABY6DC31_9RHOB|nr:UDP-2,3-diacylglucosamine diphosphatase LpxI [Roseovarius pelagicus]UXX83714.1 UDP-2,3-diacylglucosamine diphosphatase LpxI [Roseovarius pelagicus]
MAGRLAILACGGALPVQLAAAYPDAMQITLNGIPSELVGTAQSFQLEKFGTIFDAMRTAGVTRMVFAGHLARPPLDPALFDATMMRIAPGLMQAVVKGDDALLRHIIGIFEAEGFEVVGAHELLPDLAVSAGLHLGPAPTTAEEADITRGFDILDGLAPLDLGQGCAVAGGLCLGIETIQGTDAILRYIGTTPEALKRGQRGVYVKAPKRGQDLRVDMPAIGAQTIEAVADAGLAGLVIAEGQVLVLGADRVKSAVEERGIFLISRSV